jgi:hypothetical protein
MKKFILIAVAAATLSVAGAAQAQYASTNVGVQANNDWRYTWHNGQWWYWTPENRWMIHYNGSWAPYSPSTYAAMMNPMQYQQRNYNYSGNYGYNNYNYGYNNPNRYYSGYRNNNYYSPYGYNSGYGFGNTGYGYGNPYGGFGGYGNANTAVGAQIGGAIAGDAGAGIGALIGRAID